MRLTFGDMTKEVNVFNLRKQPKDMDDQTFEVNSIKNLTCEHEESIKPDTLSEFDLESKDFDLDQSLSQLWIGHQAQICQLPNLNIKFFLPMNSFLS